MDLSTAHLRKDPRPPGSFSFLAMGFKLSSRSAPHLSRQSWAPVAECPIFETVLVGSLLSATLLCCEILAPRTAAAQTPAFAEGFSLTPPSGWKLQAPDGEQIVFLGPDGLSLISVSIQQGALSNLSEQTRQPINLAGAELAPLSLPTQDGERVTNAFLVSGAGPLSRGMIMAQTAQAGRVLVAFGLTQPGLEPDLARALEAVFNSARLFSARPPPALGLPSARSEARPDDQDPPEPWRQGFQAGEADQATDFGERDDP
jgi:hypothetical protein